MTLVAAGTRLLVQGAETPLSLRTLQEVELQGGWSVTVLGDVVALQAAALTGRPVMVDFPTDQGPIRVDAEVLQIDGGYRLRALGLRAAVFVEQRRENVRALVRLPVRGTVLATSASRSQAGVELADGAPGVMLDGTTGTVSAGGVSLELQGACGVAPGATIYVELGMPGGYLAPAVLTVLDHAGSTVRARFLDISPLDRERLVRLVFTRQRVELAERRDQVGSAR